MADPYGDTAVFETECGEVMRGNIYLLCLTEGINMDMINLLKMSVLWYFND